jgi:epoxyqueuosine reductase
MDLTDAIHRFATEAGFARAGVSSPLLSDQYVTALQEYVDAGRFGTMRWMRRYYNFSDYIQERFPWAKSVLVVVDNYYQPGDWSAKYPKIARYAWGADYHKVLARQLKSVLRKIKTLEPATIARAYVDAGPVMQKPLPFRPGWAGSGKTTC